MKGKAAVHIGCSGWDYKHWKGCFYPESCPPGEWFEKYAGIFSTVEINNTFYRLPPVSTFKKWRDMAPEGFIYAVKASRFITHMKKLKDAGGAMRQFLDRAGALGNRLGPILIQLPPRWRVNAERLDGFTDELPAGFRYVFEFRDSSWYDEDVYGILSGKDMSLCLHDMKGSEPPETAIGPLSYIRFHGTAGSYGGKYPEDILDKRARFIKKMRGEGREVYAYFNNDAEANAPRDAVRLIRKVS
ncbi:MAG: DUF72 domain-containing protein [Candidatus Omnitrophota bacterium]